jgi:MerR family transcriptional regulator, light-induced transcriptional regulator
MYSPPMSNAGTPRHPIRVVSERTGISPDLLRAWEKRYRAVAPPRRPGAGQRLYSDDDVERLRLLRRVTSAGRAIGQVAALSTEALERLAREDDAERRERTRPAAPPAEGEDPYLARAVESVRALDAAALESGLMRSLLFMGGEVFTNRVVVPLLHRIGEDWREGRVGVAHEHAATPVIRRVLAFATDSVSRDGGGPEIVVATPAGQRHEMGAQLAAFTAAAAGWRVTFLGSDTPTAAIAEAARQRVARAVALGIVHAPSTPRLGAELRALRAALSPAVHIVVGGPGAAEAAGDVAAAGAVLAVTLDDFRTELERIR